MFNSPMSTSEGRDELAAQLAMVYIQKSSEPISSPEQFAQRYCNVQKEIRVKLDSIHTHG